MWTPTKLKDLRRRYGQHLGKRTETQAELALRLAVDVTTIQCWEQGKGEPSGPACRLLDRLEEDLAKDDVRELQPA